MPTWAMTLFQILWPIFKPLIRRAAKFAWSAAEEWVENNLDSVEKSKMSKGEYKAALFNWKMAQERETEHLSTSDVNLLRENTHAIMTRSDNNA